MDTDKIIWAPHPIDGYTLGRIVDIGTDTLTVEATSDPKKPIVAAYSSIYSVDELDKDVDDNCSLMYLNEATLLNNVKKRYLKDRIYTYVANVLIAVNPYYEVPKMYSSDAIKQYKGKSLGVLPPHIFAIADKAYRDMRVLKTSQAIVVSGESGSGKTETTKYILKYLTECYGAHAGPIEQRIVESNPLLEAFGNAKTVRNNNSSRFGKFIEIHFDSKGLVAGGTIAHYLLEKSRICGQASEERNYHIFYRICAGATADLRQKLMLAAPDKFHYLDRGNTQYFCTKHSERVLSDDQKSKQYLHSGSLRDIQLDDVGDFRSTDSAMSDMGLTADEKTDIYTLVAAVLHLGNITFEDSQSTQGGCRITAQSQTSLTIAAQQLGISDPNILSEALTYKVTQAARGGAQDSTVRIALRCEEAGCARDALAKAVYARLFDYIVTRVNQALPFSSSVNYMGVLDIAGFEYFQRNSFEQFCINYCNEKLQQFFNERILKEEQILYEKEGLGVKKIDFVDNQDCIDLIERRNHGIFDLLDEESKLPKPSPEHFTSEVFTRNSGHPRLCIPRKSKLKAHREVRDDEGFLVRHYAGAVCYHTELFIEKNNDALHASLEAAIQTSGSKLVHLLFQVEKQESASILTTSSRKPGAGKLNFISVGSKFRNMLDKLMEKLKSTGTNFIRCLKPNVRMIDHCFEGANVLSQLQCSGVPDVLDLMEQGYPSRTKFDELYAMYKGFLPPELSRLDPRLFCKLLFKTLGLNEHDFKFGITKIFFRPGKFAEFDQLLRSDPEHLAQLTKKVKVWLLRYRWRKAQYGVWEVIKLKHKIAWRRQQIVIVQKTMRAWLCVRKYRPRIRGLVRLTGMRKELPQLSGIASQLKHGAEAGKQRVTALTAEFDTTAKQIRSGQFTRNADIKGCLGRLAASVDREMANLKKQVEAEKAREEQERLRKIQEEMEKERRKREEDERQRLAQEEEKKIKLQMEAKRRAEEEALRVQMEAEIKAAQTLQRQREEEDKQASAKARELELERRDRELALRLANEDASRVEELPSLARSPAVLAQRQAASEKKFDLTKWKYADLRDTINTSCDVQLLDACREEFHRRLKVYQEWKSKQKKNTAATPPTPATTEHDTAEMRAPQEVFDNESVVNKRPPTTTSSETGVQRYFRIPFVRPKNRSHHQREDIADQPDGWWWAHFDGRYVARQLEVHEGVQPVLLIAGVHDMSMCELPLEETGLTHKKGAEMTEFEFDNEWNRHGGADVLKAHKGKLASEFLRRKMAATSK